MENLASFLKSSINKPGDAIKQSFSSSGTINIGGKIVKEGPILSEGE
jgi:hypothetical protein